MAFILKLLRSKIFQGIAGIVTLAISAWAIVSYIEKNAVEEIKLQEKLNELLIWERTKDATDDAPDNPDDALDFLLDRRD